MICMLNTAVTRMFESYMNTRVRAGVTLTFPFSRKCLPAGALSVNVTYEQATLPEVRLLVL